MPSPRNLWVDQPAVSDDRFKAPEETPGRLPPRRTAADRQPAAPPPPPPRRNRLAVILSTATLLVAGAAILIALTDDDNPASGPAATLPAASGGRPSDTRVGEIYAAAAPSVVSVQAASGGGAAASGTGFVIDANGTIVTNSHVVEDADQARVRFDDDGALVPAEVVGSDPSSDLAVLRVDPSDARKPLRALPLADSDTVKVGDAAVAIGFPLGLDKTATAGIVSGLNREIQAPNGFQIDDVIQTDAPINPGNSGGPLLDDRGRVIGVNSQIATAGGSSGNVGIGFAVPSNAVRQVVPQLRQGQTIDRPYLGVSTGPSTTGQAGAVITEVNPGGPAQRAGLQGGTGVTGTGGDVIVSIDGRPVRAPNDVSAAIENKRPGDTVQVEVLRDGARRTIDVELGKRPTRTP
jgi:putative serine protease PepD